MQQTALDTLATFTIDSLPTLDVVVMGALQLLASREYPKPVFAPEAKYLVLGSGNALHTGKILLRNNQANFADENNFAEALMKYADHTEVLIISASGGKHAVHMAQSAILSGKHVTLFTNNPEPLALQYVPREQVMVYPRNREPYTYNTSTYLSMIFGSTGENPQAIASYLEEHVNPLLLRNFDSYGAFTIIVPSSFAHLTAMVRTKFDELFGPMVVGRVFTEEEMKHAKTVIESPDELFISVGVQNEQYGIPKHRLYVPTPHNAEYGAMIALAYYVVGKIQTAHPPYFKNSIVRYAQKTSAMFNQTITPIVE
jgi:hypothetical protein